jgi:hypothetical protein
MRAWRSGKQVDSVSSSVGVGGAVGGGFGEVKFLGGRVILVVSVEMLLFASLADVSVGIFAGFEGRCGCSTAYEICLKL